MPATITTITVPLDADLAGAVDLNWETRVGLQILRNQEKQMAALDNLNQAVANLQTTTANLINGFNAEFQQLKDAIAANQAAANDPAIQAAADKVNAVIAQEQAALAANTLPAAAGSDTVAAS